MKYYIVLFLVLLAFSSSAWAGPADVNVVGIDEAPMSYIDNDGALKGISIDVAKEIMSRLGYEQDIPVYPWARTRQMLLKQPEVVGFTVARTDAREDKYHWIHRLILPAGRFIP